jgi:phenylacetate-CoA ligase
LLATPGYGGEYRIIVSREQSMDELVVQTEVDIETDADEERLEAFRSQLGRELRATLGLRTTIRIERPGTIPRTEFKARRVIDDRDLYRQATGGS